MYENNLREVIFVHLMINKFENIILYLYYIINLHR